VRTVESGHPAILKAAPKMLAVNLEAHSVGTIATPLRLIVSVASRTSPGQTPTGGDPDATMPAGAGGGPYGGTCQQRVASEPAGRQGLGHRGVSPAVGGFIAKRPSGFVDREQAVVLTEVATSTSG
jgi:hypothetical protein